MEEQLVSFQTAKLAKEKGFDVPTLHKVHCSHFHQYEKEGQNANVPLRSEFLPKEENWNGKKHPDPNNSKGTLIGLYLSLPTQTVLQRWLRKKYGIYVWCEPITILGTSKPKRKWRSNYHKPGILNTDYEKALEIGLYEALKLIK